MNFFPTSDDEIFLLLIEIEKFLDERF